MSFANHSQLLRTRRRLRNHANSRKYGQARISFDSEAGGPHKLILSQNSLDGGMDDQGPQCVVPGQPWQPQQGDITSFSFYFCAQNFPSYTMRMTAQNKMVWGIRAALARIGARSLFNPYVCVAEKSGQRRLAAVSRECSEIVAINRPLAGLFYKIKPLSL